MKTLKLALLALFLCQLMNGCSEQASQQIRLGAWLQYFPGNAEGSALLRLTLFSEENNNALQVEADELKQLIEKESSKNFVLQVGSNGQTTVLENAQVQGKIKYGKRQGSEALELVMLYRLKSEIKPQPGSSIAIHCSTPDLAFSSNAVTIPAPATAALHALQRDARVCALLQDSKCLQKVSRTMLKDYPTSFSSFWFTAIALEQSGNSAEAVKTLETGLSYLPNPDKSTPETGHIDTSPEVFDKIKALRAN